MAFTKTENRIARTGPDDVRISFHVAKLRDNALAALGFADV